MAQFRKSLVMLPVLLALAALVFLLTLNAPPTRANGGCTFTVNSTSDAGDANLGDGQCNDGTGKCTLRAAIQQANISPCSGHDTIQFSTAISGQVITISSALDLLDEDGVTINGDINGDGRPDIRLRYGSGEISGLRVRSSNNVIRGLSIGGFPSGAAGIYLQGTAWAVNSNTIISNFIGVDLDGTTAVSNVTGIYVESGLSGAAGNVIRGNLVAGNSGRGIAVEGPATGTLIIANRVGTNLAGTAALTNTGSGIWISATVSVTVQENLVSGNNGNGISIYRAQNTAVLSNIVGLNAAGTAALPNLGTAGILIDQNASGTTLRGNTVSGNRNNGIYLGSGVTGTVIAGNRIGTNPAGTVGIGNGIATNRDGIQIDGASNTTVGGPNPGDRNIIAANKRAGILIAGDTADNNVIQNNYIGTDVSGQLDIGNGYPLTVEDTGHGGIYIGDGSDNNLIQSNLVRFNYIGIRFSGVGNIPPQGNQVLSNTITNNDMYGIASRVTHNNTSRPTPAGGDTLIAHNVITGTGYPAMGTGIGIYNLGASPHILMNTIASNKDIGIVNRVEFGVDGPANASDDILSVPYIFGNTIDGNGNDGIQSRDTAPLNRYTLHVDNNIGNNNGQPDVSQRWFGAVEAITGTQPIIAGLVVTVTKTGGVGSACAVGACSGNVQDGGAWGPAGFVYTDVEKPDGTSTWFEIIEFEIEWDGRWITYTPHYVQVGGAHGGARAFSFDGVTTTQEVTGDVGLPTCIPTGILNNPQHSFCRYQIAQVRVYRPGTDEDQDGIPNEQEGTGDTDGDGIPDYLDTDSDNDGIPDAVEGTRDTDGDGIPDFRDPDSDNDGIPDAVEGNVDTDGDGTPDYRDTDSDNDGIPDDVEYDNCQTPPCDADGDGIPDFRERDSDNDGVTDNAEGTGDTDGDGIPNYRDTDSDNDGIPDGQDPDDDGDGIPDTAEGLTDNPGNDWDSSVDTDGDGLPDYLDRDSDNDQVPDWMEAGCTQQPSGNQTCPNPNRDSDGDGKPDRLDNDDDGDGIPTANEYYAGSTDQPFCTDPAGLDTDRDGTVNCQDNDVDGDGIPNYLDRDSDNDGTPDRNESTTQPNPPPFGHGNVPAWIDPMWRIYLPLVLRNY
ncbi:MAG: right-handed parallel beta-helix repeat-containing protein [Anaerolineae bacterium]|nr:right-handed parallel beta-helix repeat-containing protein [Anaerolineae bacterium]